MKTFTYAVSVGLAVVCAAGGMRLAHAGDGHHQQRSASTGAQPLVSLGQPGDRKNVDRTIEIAMNDLMRFSPASVSVRRNETIRFVLKNEGRLNHEMVLGSIGELKKHAASMRKFPEMEHAEPNQASVAAGQTGELVWRFTRAGKVDFACLQPGHFEAGMKGRVMVSKTAFAATTVPAAALQTSSTSSSTTATAMPTAEATTTVSATAASTPPAPDAAALDFTEGEVRKVDADNRKITIKHGDIKHLDMPGMTMVFAIKDAAQLKQLKPGDKVKFKAEKAGGGFVVTDLRPIQ